MCELRGRAPRPTREGFGLGLGDWDIGLKLYPKP